MRIRRISKRQRRWYDDAMADVKSCFDAKAYVPILRSHIEHS